MKTKIHTLIIVLSFFILSGCDALIDCIASATPELSNKNLAIGSVGFGYNDVITSSVKNDSHDNDYGYYFTIEGTLPPGISFGVVGREIRFFGTPSSAGSYTIKVGVKIDPPYNYNDNGFADSDRICLGNDTTHRNYTFIIN